MSAGRDLAGSRLPEDLRQPLDRYDIAPDDVGQNRSWADARQLVNIVDQQKVSMSGQCLHQSIEKRQINHGTFVADQNIALQGILCVARKPTRPRLKLQ